MNKKLLKFDVIKILFRKFITLILFTSAAWSFNTLAGALHHAPEPDAPCPAGSINVYDSNATCTTNETNADTFLVGAGATYTAGKTGATVIYTYEGKYAPYSGPYFMRVHICPSQSAGLCNIAASSTYIDSLNTVKLSSQSDIASQDPDMGGPKTSMTIPYSFTICQTIVDSAGVEWGPSSNVSCPDANPLPDTPAACYINFGQDLDVSLGELERAKIASAAGSGTVQEKKIKVLCTRDAGETVNTQFKFTPLSVSGNELISTSNNGLGIGLYYNGKRVNTEDVLTETYALGYTDVTLGFEALRDPSVELKYLPTGEFTANAVMVMTEQ